MSKLATAAIVGVVVLVLLSGAALVYLLTLLGSAWGPPPR